VGWCLSGVKVEFDVSRLEAWAIVLFCPLLLISMAAFTLFPSYMKSSLYGETQNVFELVLSNFPSWLISLVAFWCLIALLARILEAIFLLKSGDLNFTVRQDGISLATGRKTRFFSWDEMALIYISVKRPDLRLKIRLHREYKRSFRGVLRRFFFIHTIPDTHGPTLDRVIDELTVHMKKYAPEDILEIKDND